MNTRSNRSAFMNSVKLLCLCVLCIILVAGLWPFHAPKNQVHWREHENGLGFGRFGSLVSAGAFRENGVSNDESGSLEIWVEPGNLQDQHAILSFDGSEHPGSPFSLRQNKDALRVQRHNIDSRGTSRTVWFDVRGAFRDKKPVLVTISLGKQETSVYLDGVMAQASSISGSSTNNLTGRLIVANSPHASDSWPGRICGLAIYHRELTLEQVAQHYEDWIRNQQPALVQDEAPVALYLFNERSGNMAHNQLDPETDLTIPLHYFVLHQTFLASVLHDYRATWSYWKDVGVNIAGFLPFGFCFVAYFSSVRTIKHAATTTIALGFVISLTIEVLQAFLPTRSSGSTDLITNTLGTALGVMFYRWSLTQNWFAEIRRYDSSEDCLERTPELEAVSAESDLVETSTSV
jgi:VanZ family protein